MASIVNIQPNTSEQDAASKVYTEFKDTAQTATHGGTVPSDLNVMTLLPADCNVIDYYNWTVTDMVNQSYKDKIPRITLTEYQPTGSQFLSSFVTSIETAATTLGAPNLISAQLEKHPDIKAKYTEYKERLGKKVTPQTDSNYIGLYTGEYTGNSFVFPFSDTYVADIHNTWGQGSSIGAIDAVNRFSNMLGNVIGDDLNGAGAVDAMKIWSPDGPSTYTFSFELHNTMIDPSERLSHILKNYQLVRTLKYNNLPERLSVNVMMQPCIYKVDIPGVHFSPASAITGLKVESLGQKDMMRLPITMDYNGTELVMSPADSIQNTKLVEVPDAYKITITMTDLYVTSKNLYAESFIKNQSINVIV